MELKEVNLKTQVTEPKLAYAYNQLQELIQRLNEKDISDLAKEKINLDIDEINNSSLIGRPLLATIKKKQANIVKLVEKEFKIVPINYYRNLWIALGMSLYGLPIGVAFGLSMGNIGLLAIGLPIGLAIGAAVGTRLDKKVKQEGRQLNIELK